MELNNFTIDILRPNQQLAAELTPHPKGYDLPKLAQFVQNSDREYRGCNNNNSVKKELRHNRQTGGPFSTVVDTTEVDTIGTGLCG